MKWIAKQRDLDATLDSLDGIPAVAVDTEADSLHSYFDKVCLIQLSVPGEDLVIDPLSGIDLAPLGRLLSNPEVRTVMHGADYDVRILQRDFGFRVTQLNDTMICAQLLGYDGVGLAALLKRHFGVDLDKSHQKANWSLRPLPAPMLRYAALDTHYLIELADRLQSELEQLGRWEWALEEFRRLQEIRFEEAVIDPESFRKIKGSNRLEPRGLAVLALLHGWRDRQARRLDRPPFKVIGNEALVDIATNLPRDMQALERLEKVASFHVRKYGREILALVDEAIARPEAELPERILAKPWMRDKALERRIERLKKVRDALAAELRIESSILAPRHVLTAIATDLPRRLEDLDAIPAMRQWQKRVVGQPLLDAVRQ